MFLLLGREEDEGSDGDGSIEEFCSLLDPFLNWLNQPNEINVDHQWNYSVLHQRRDASLI